MSTQFSLVRILLTVATLNLCGCGHTKSENSQTGTVDSTGDRAYFVEVSDQVGLNFLHQAGHIGDYSMPQIMGSGAALFDFDGDGNLDVYLVNGGDLQSSKSEHSVLGRLFRQKSDGSFVDVTQSSALRNPGYGMGVAVGDIDNDGDLDVYITNYGPDRLFQNNGDGTFLDITETSRIANLRWGTSASFVDYDQDGWLDLVVINYLDYFPGSICQDGSGRRDYCGPVDFPGTSDRLYRNMGYLEDGESVFFSDETVSSGLASHLGRGLGVLCRDFNNDNRPDIYVANDMEANCLWIQQNDGTFRDEAVLRGVAVNLFGEAEASMGVAWGDVNGDGHSDLFLTHLRGESNTLYLGNGTGYFLDATAGSDVGPPSVPMTGFGTAMIDLDNDGDLDFVIVNGRVKRAPPIESEMRNDYWKDYAEPNQIFFNDGSGHFHDTSRFGGLFSERVEVSRGLVYGDIDNDGDVDLLVTNCGGAPRLYRNEIPHKGHWLVLRILDPALNRDALGARITFRAGNRTYQREVIPSSGYLTSNDTRIFVGLGDALNYESITVRWPDGMGVDEVFPGGDVDSFVVITKGSGRRKTQSSTK